MDHFRSSSVHFAAARTREDHTMIEAHRIAVLAACAWLVSIADAGAQSYPTRPVRFVVAAAPGGTPDILARILAPKMHEQLGQPLIVDNRPGATGNIGAEVAARAQPDGYTILMATSVLAISPAFYRKLAFNAAADLAAVTQ